MSFGWSTGDIVSAIRLANKIIICVSNVGGSQEHFQELESELRALVRALNEISDLTKVPGQLPEITALKFAACLCEETLKRFFGRIKPFDKSLGGEARKGESKLKAVPRMVRWELLVKKDVPEFRTYLVAHVGSLNMRLSTALLKLSATSREISDTNHLEQQKSTLAVRQQLTEQTRLVCQTITGIYQQDTIPKLDSLLDVASSIWRTQAELMEIFAKAVQALPPPDLNYTWAQAPIRFEDALGRVIPVPSEYDWDKLEAIILAQFKEGPGHRKVRSGEYELFHGSRSIKPFGSRGCRRLPGMKITMTFVVGQYVGSERCPRVGCSSRLFSNDGGIPISVKICAACQGSFRISSTILPRPLKQLDQNAGHISTGLTSERQQHMLKWHHAEYDDRSTYKNISIYITELPPTPTKFRHKYHRSRELLQKNARVSEQHSLAHTLNSQGLYVHQHHTIARNPRPQTEVYCPIPRATVSLRPATLSYEGGHSTSLRQQPPSLPLSHKPPLERLMDEVGGALLDKEFMDELSAIEQYFRVLSEAQRTALLYALVQQTKASTFFGLILPVMREWLNTSISAQGG